MDSINGANENTVATPPEITSVFLQRLPIRGCLSLRMRESDARMLSVVGGFKIDLDLNTAWRDGKRCVARVGVDEWFLWAPYSDLDIVSANVRAAVADTKGHLVDISHRHTGWMLSGEMAADVLNAGCPLDLSDNRFPSGAATRTVFAKADITLVREAGGFRVECARSFSNYLESYLERVIEYTNLLARVQDRD